MATTNGAAAMEWARKTLLQGLPLGEMEAGVSAIPAGSEGVFFQPYLNGERAPFRESRAAGAFLGITPRHSAFHLMRAVFEGLAYSLRDCYEHLPKGDTPVILAGGASASQAMCQICADVLQRPMLRVPEQEFGLFGMACALLETLGFEITQSAPEQRGELFIPRDEFTPLYQEGYAIYRQLRDASMDFWAARDRFIQRSK